MREKKVTYFNKLSFTEYGIWDLKLFLFILQTNQSILKKLVCTIANFFNDCREFVLASVTIFCVFHTYFRLLNRRRLSNKQKGSKLCTLEYYFIYRFHINRSFQ